MQLNPGGLLAALIVLLVTLGPMVVRAFRNARRRVRTRAETQAWLHKQRDGKPALSAADVEELRQWLAQEALPFASLVAAAEPPTRPIASRLGGPAFLPEGANWPFSAAGRPYIFLCQINFADMPGLPDYPETGLLGFFIADEDAWGLNYEEGEKSDVAVLYAPDPASSGRLVQRPCGKAECSPFSHEDVGARGRALRFDQTGVTAPSGSDWRIERRWPAWQVREGDARFASMLEADVAGPGPSAYVGGQPRFTQNDPRNEGRPFDRVLLQVGSDHNIMWGDAGEAVFMIRREDLLARNFTRVMFSWDCH